MIRRYERGRSFGDIGGRRVERRRLEKFSQGETRGSVEGLVLGSCFKQLSWLYTSKLDVYRFVEVIMTLSSDRLVEMAARQARRARGRLEAHWRQTQPPLQSNRAGVWRLGCSFLEKSP